MFLKKKDNVKKQPLKMCNSCDTIVHKIFFQHVKLKLKIFRKQENYKCFKIKLKTFVK